MARTKLRGARRSFQITRIVQHLRAARKGGNHQAVPSRDDLVVEMRPRPLRAKVEQTLRGLRRASARISSSLLLKMLRRLRDGVPLDQDILPVKLAVRIAAGRRVAVRLRRRNGN